MTGLPHLAPEEQHGDKLYRLSEMPMPMVAAAHRMILDCNELFAHQFGYDRRELINRSFRWLYPDTKEFVRTGELWRTHLASGVVYFDERVMRRKDGTRFWCRVHGRSATPDDPFAEAIYCFEPMLRGVAPADHVLSGRQRQILMLMAQGLSNESIALQIGRSRRTVEAHRARLMKIAGVHNGVELMVWFSERDTR